MEDQQFIKGFNNGYFLAEHQPGLLDTLMAGIAQDSPYVEGLKEGHQQRVNERDRDRIQQSIQQTNTQDKGKSRGK